MNRSIFVLFIILFGTNLVIGHPSFVSNIINKALDTVSDVVVATLDGVGNIVDAVLGDGPKNGGNKSPPTDKNKDRDDDADVSKKSDKEGRGNVVDEKKEAAGGKSKEGEREP